MRVGGTMKVLLTITLSHPDLLSDLEALAPRARSERLRLLATVGLLTMRGGLSALSAAAETTKRPVTDHSAAAAETIKADPPEDDRLNLGDVRAFATVLNED